MKKLLITSLFIIAFITPSWAQDTFPEGLTKVNAKDMGAYGKVQLNELKHYDEEGQLMDFAAVIKLAQARTHRQTFYANEKGELVAVGWIKRSEAEIARRKSWEAERARMAAMVGTEAKNFEVTDMDGNRVELADLKGSVVAVNFWFIGCKPCIMEIPELNEIVHEFEGKPVKFVAIALDSKAALELFAKKKQFDYDIVPKGRFTAGIYGISSYPTHLLIDKEGKIAYFKSGYSPTTAKEVGGTIAELLK